MPAGEPRVFVLTACHNRCAITAGFARDVRAQDLADIQLVLVDDGSADGTAERVRSLWPDRLTVVTGYGSWWWGGSMHQGLCAIACQHPGPKDVVVFANDDIALGTDFIRTGVDALPPSGSMILARGVDSASGVVFEAGQRFRCWRLDVRPAIERITCAPTRGLFIRWRDVLRVGGFRPERLPHYYSDYEWTIRAVRRGIHIASPPNLQVRVQVDASGMHGLQDRGCRYRRRLWSIRHAGNPIYQIRFAGLVCPWPLAALHLVRIWLQTMIRLAIRA